MKRAIQGIAAARAAVVVLAALGVAAPLPAGAGAHCPAGATFSDSFEDNDLNPWQTQGGAARRAGVSQDTSDDGSHSAFVHEGEIFLRSPNVDLSTAISADLSLWVRRGDDAFSEDPDVGHDLVLQYNTGGNNWATLQTFSGDGTPGEVFEPSFALPADAFHANFRLRFHLLDGGGPNRDFWHMDSICLTSVSGGAVDHYAIAHDGSAVTCVEEPVTITGHNAAHAARDPGPVTIQLTSDTGEGTWARVITGSGTLADASAGDGAAEYTFPGGEDSVTLAFNYTTVTAATDPETVNFDVNSGQTDPSEDPDLVVSRSGLRITDGSGSAQAIPPQIAGKRTDQAPGAQSLGLQAVRASDADPSVCEPAPAFPDGQDVEVELGAECRDPASCAGEQLRVSNNGNTSAVATAADNGGTGTASYTPVTLRFGANAEAAIALAYDDAGEMQLHARYNPIDDGSGTPPVVEYVTGASNVHAWRPFGFHLDFDPDGDGVFDDRRANASCGAQVSCAADGSGDVFATAGVDFAARIAAVVWQSGDDADADGVPDSNQAIGDNALTPNFGNESTPEAVDLTHALVAPTGGGAGALAGGGGLTGFSGGTLEASGLSWSEVGIIDLDAALADGDYLGSGQDASGSAPNVGRFIPARFAVAVADAGMYALTCGGAFNYTGEDFGYATGNEPRLTVTAQNDAGATTSNYSDGLGGDFAKLAPAQVATTAPTQDASATGISGANLDVSATLATGALTDNADGTLSYTFATADRFRYDRVADARVAPFAADLPIDVAGVSDADGVSAPALPLTFTPSDPGAGGDVEIRFGRLVVDNAAGAEVAPLDLPLRAEHWDGATWVANTADSCTDLALASEIRLSNDTDPDSPVDGTQPIDVGGGTTSITSGDVALASGTAAVTFSAPGAGNTGWVELEALLAAGSPSADHLRGDWDGDGSFDDNPVGRATFGIYEGNDAWIHLRRAPVN